MQWDIFESKSGPILLISSSQGLIRLTVPTQNPQKILDDIMIETDSILVHRENSIIKRTKMQLNQYFEGQREKFYLPLDLHGTVFQKKVWRALIDIPYGQTRSYQDIAVEINNENACRAVGMANHANPLPIVIPCHRVIAKGGTLGGYADNSDISLQFKKDLLMMEQKTSPLKFGKSLGGVFEPTPRDLTPNHQ